MATKKTKTSTAIVPLPAEKDIKTVASRLSALTILTNPASANEASIAVGHRATLKDMQKQVKEKKEAITKPLNESLKRVRELFKPIETQIADAIQDVTDGLALYNQKVQEELDEKRERLEERVEEGDIDEEKASRIIAKASDRLGAAVIPTREVKVVKVTDESKVPDRYWVLDMTTIRRDALDGVKIPGVVVETEDQIYNKKG